MTKGPTAIFSRAKFLTDPFSGITWVMAIYLIAGVGMVLRFFGYPHDHLSFSPSIKTLNVAGVTLAIYIILLLVTCIANLTSPPNPLSSLLLPKRTALFLISTSYITVPFLHVITGRPDSDLFLFFFIPILTGCIISNLRFSTMLISGISVYTITYFTTYYFSESTITPPFRGVLNTYIPRVSALIVISYLSANFSSRLLSTRSSLRRSLESLDELYRSTPTKLNESLLKAFLSLGFGKASLWLHDEMTHTLVLELSVSTDQKGQLDITRGERMSESSENFIWKNISKARVPLIFRNQKRFRHGFNDDIVRDGDNLLRRILYFHDGDASECLEGGEILVSPLFRGDNLIGKIVLSPGSQPASLTYEDLYIVQSLVQVAGQLLEESHLLNSIPLMMYRIDRDGRITWANESYCDEMGKSRESLIGKNAYELFPQDLAEKYTEDDDRVMETLQPLDKRESHRLINGQNRVVRVLKTPLVRPISDSPEGLFSGDESQNRSYGVQAIYWDEDLEPANLRMLQSKKIFFGEMHHRTRNMLYHLQSVANQVKTEISPKGAVLKIGELISTLDAMSTIHEILYETDAHSELELVTLVTRLAEQYNAAYSPRGRNRDIHIDIPISFRFDDEASLAIGICICELLLNSLKHGHENADSREENFQISINFVVSESGRFELSVSDNGGGDPLQVSRLVRSEKTSGLTLLSELVKFQLDGEVKFGTNNNRGLRVTISFPEPAHPDTWRIYTKTS